MANLTIYGESHSHSVSLSVAIAAHKLMERLAIEREQFEFWQVVSPTWRHEIRYPYNDTLPALNSALSSTLHSTR